ncbi:MAG: terpene synthase family protein, partial [Thermomicrobiales bacterium]
MDALVAHALRDELAQWAALFPVLSGADLAAVAGTVAVHLPDVGGAERVTAGLITLWTLAFDALVDNGELSAALDALTAWYGAIVDSVPGAPPAPPAGVPAPGVDLGRVLAALGRRLAAAHTFPALAPTWRASFARMTAAIVAQRRLVLDVSVLPTTVELLSLTEESIGVAHYLAACWILYDDPCLTSRLPSLTELAATCARVIRLANDLRTWAREEREGMVNLVVAEAAAIGRRDPALTADECHTRACQVLATVLAAEVAHLRAGQAASPSPAGAPDLGLV